MSYNYNYGGHYGGNQSDSQQQQPTNSSSYQSPSYPALSNPRSTGTVSNDYGRDQARYQYTPQGTNDAGAPSNSGWNTFSRANASTSAGSSSQRYGSASNSNLNSSHAHSTQPAQYAQPSQNLTYASYQQNQPQSHNSVAHNAYGQQQARPDSVSSSGSVAAAAPPRPQNVTNHQQRPLSHQQRASQDMRTSTRSPLQPQAQHGISYQQNRSANQAQSPSVGHQQSQNQQAQSTQGGYQQTQRASNTSGPVTVDPSQVYDRTAELQREAAKAEAARKVEQERLRVEEQRRQAQEEKERREQAENAKKLAEARKLSEKGANNPDGAKKKRGRKSNAEKATNGDAAANAAAMTLMQTANASGSTGATAGEAGELENQMKAMFAKMREFNAMNPELLSKMWQQERESYLAGEAEEPQEPKDQQTKGSTGTTTSPAATKPKKKRTPKKDKPSKGVDPQGSTTTPSTESTTKTSLQQQPINGATPSTSAGSTKQGEKPKPLAKTVWPEKRKAQLAQAASSLINRMPENASRSVPITSEEIARMLDGNPSYLELCNQIEAKGYQLNKSQFAKALLTAVPEVNRQKAGVTAASPSTQQSGPFPPANGIPSISTPSQQQTTALGDAENRLLSGESIIGKSSSGGRPRKSEDTPSKRKSTVQTPSAEHGLIPADDIDPNLEGLGVINQFNERPGEPPQKVFSPTTDNKQNKKKHRPSITPAPALPPSKENLARKRTFADLVDLTALSDDDAGPSAKRFDGDGEGEEMIRSATSQNAPQQLPTPPHTTEPYQRQPSQQNPALQATMVSASAQQPQGTHPPLVQPGHLHKYPQPIYHPTAPSHPVQSKTTHSIPRDHPIHNIMVGEKIAKSNVLRRSKYNPKTIARDVLLASGRHPDMRHLNAHLDVLRHLKLKDDIDLSTIRWDVIDPGGALPGAGISTEPFPEEEMNDADDESSDNDSVLGGRVTQSIPLSYGGAATVAFEGAHHATNPSLRIKQWKNRKSDPGVRQVTTPNRAPSTAAPSSTGGGYAALRVDGDQPKKKGRPVGWRKWMQKDKGSDSPAPAATSNSGKRIGRPPGSTNKPPPKPPSPEFPAFKCEWEGCAAELHNLNTLRRHIFKIHGEKRTGAEWLCRWKGCGKATSVKEGPRTVSKFVRRLFDEGKDWETHVDDEHLRQIKWAQGDGPAAGLAEGDGEVTDAVLSDREGRRVTPRISMPSSPAEAVQRVEVERREGAQGPAPDSGSGKRRQTPLEEAQAELYSAEEKRRRLGVGIDKGGATLVTDKRRRGFIEDGDVEMVSDDD